MKENKLIELSKMFAVDIVNIKLIKRNYVKDFDEHEFHQDVTE